MQETLVFLELCRFFCVIMFSLELLQLYDAAPLTNISHCNYIDCTSEYMWQAQLALLMSYFLTTLVLIVVIISDNQSSVTSDDRVVGVREEGEELLKWEQCGGWVIEVTLATATLWSPAGGLDQYFNHFCDNRIMIDGGGCRICPTHLLPFHTPLLHKRYLCMHWTLIILYSY